MIKKSKRDNIFAAKRRGREKGCSYCKTNTIPNWQEYEKMAEFLSTSFTQIASRL